MSMIDNLLNKDLKVIYCKWCAEEVSDEQINTCWREGCPNIENDLSVEQRIYRLEERLNELEKRLDNLA